MSEYFHVRQDRPGHKTRHLIARHTTTGRTLTVVAEVPTEHAARELLEKLNATPARRFTMAAE